MSLRLFLLAAASPLCLAAGVARAETAISATVTSPVATANAASGAPDDIHVTTSGAVKPSAGAAITLNSNNSVKNEGLVSFSDASNAVGIAVQGGRIGEVRSTGTIQLDETYTAADTNGDGIVDGVFAKGAGRFGVQLTGADPFHGSIITTGAITVKGNDSAAISVEALLDGELRSGGTVSVTGDRSFGVHATASVAGNVTLSGGSVSVQGAGAVGLAVDNNIGGRLRIDQAVTVTGYRSTSRPTDAVIAKMTADELQQGGPAVRVAGDVAGGVLIAAPPGTLDAAHPDLNKDGVPDAQEGAGALVVFGSAPALLVGNSSRAVHLGALNADLPYGLTILGSASSAGVYDGVAATGVQLGGLGGTVNLDGGVYVGGSIAAASAKADATALRLGAGTLAPAVVNAGSIKASAAAADAFNVTAVRIDAGAQATSLNNSGVIAAAITGTKGQAVAVRDLAGSLTSITNTNQVSATITPTDTSAVTGSQIAFDLRANTQGVTLTQSANSSAAVTPAIAGDVLFGAGTADLNLLAGTLTGAVAFGGAANDSLKIDNGATLTGAVTKAGGQLALDIANGKLVDTAAQPLALSSLNVGAAGALVITLDPAKSGSGGLDVAGTANIATGAKLGLRFATKLVDPATFTLVKAGTLNVGTIDQSLLGTMPFIDRATLRVDTAQNAIVADVRRRTAGELGFNASESAAYDAVFANFDRDPAVRDALLAKTDQAGFSGLYDQLLPDHSGGLFQTLAAANLAAARGIDQGDGRLRPDGYRAWTQEIAIFVQRDVDRASRFDSSGFGLAAGLETPARDYGVLGVQASFVSADVDEKARSNASSLNGSQFAAGVYWKNGGEGLTANLALTGGYAWMSEERVVADSSAGLSKTAKSDWSGYTLAAHGDLAWRADLGAFFVKPELTLDYFRLQEDGRTEHGGGTSIDLVIDKRTSQELDAFAGVVLGARFGRSEDFTWSPELTLGYRGTSGDGAGPTRAHFLAGGPNFSIAAPDLNGGGAVIRAALRGQGPYFDFALEGGGEIRDHYEAYDARMVARWSF